jgi:diguanylate cyclase (GGDEF)-like protein
MLGVEDNRIRRGRRPATPVWVLLVALTLIPTVAMGTFAARDAGASAAAARHAGVVADDVADLVAVLELSFVLTSEQMPTQTALRADSVGISLDAVSEVLGFDVEERLDEARRDTDAALAGLDARALDRYPDVARIRADLPALRTAVDAADANADADAIHHGYVRLAWLAEQATLPELRRLTAGNHLVDARATATLESFAAISASFEMSQREVLAVSDVAFGAGDTGAVLRLAHAAAQYQRDMSRLDDLADPALAERARRVSAAPETQRFAAAVQSMLLDPGWMRDASPMRFAQVFADGFDRIDHLMGLSRAAASASVVAARAAEDDARAEHRRVLGGSLAVGALVLVAAVVVAWSITRPLRVLSRFAGELTDGDLRAAPPIDRGPGEVRTAARALDELAGNLRRVAEQARALAGGSLDDPVLTSAVPGALGESVHGSVAQLSASLREQEALRGRLAEQAHRDLLTGLPNRAGFLVAVDHALARARRAGSQVALLTVDLDGFKRSNDSFGHAFGDRVLRVTADRLVGAARGGDLVARLGSDEFAVIAEPISGPAEAAELAERLRVAVSEAVERDGASVRIAASVGVALNQDDDDEGDDLLADADQAVQRAKASGGGRVEVGDEALRREVAERHDIEEALRVGIQRGELQLHYQPIVDTDTGRLGGFEALVRWLRPGHGLVPPMAFIPVAEKSDLVVELGRWVLDEAAAQLAAWSTTPELADAYVTVNISGRHLLSPVVVEDVRHALERADVDARRLVVEITETVVLSDLDVAVRHLTALRALGVRVALDDFGTGYTSIGQLGRLPVDVLKIDRSFVSALARSEDRSLVELMVEVGRTLGMTLVAEGVEERAELEVLRTLRCDGVQGYLVCRPLPAPDAREWSAVRPDVAVAGFVGAASLGAGRG